MSLTPQQPRADGPAPGPRAPLGGSEVHVVTGVGATNERYKLPPRLFDARCKSCWFVFGLICLTIASFWTLPSVCVISGSTRVCRT